MRVTIASSTKNSILCTRSHQSHASHARPAKAAIAALLACSMVTAYAPAARAEEVSPTGKGMVGGGLLGAEVVTITESLIGIRNPWAYVIGGVVGAGGGVA